MLISLSKLKADRAAMIQGEWWVCDSDGAIHAGSDGGGMEVGPVDWYPGDLLGAIATHNAADALIAIVEAALAWRKSIDEGAGCVEDALRAALSKVSP